MTLLSAFFPFSGDLAVADVTLAVDVASDFTTGLGLEVSRILSRLEDLVDELQSETSIAYVLALPEQDDTMVEGEYPWGVEAAAFAPGASHWNFDPAHFRTLQLARDLAEVLSGGRPFGELSDPSVKAGFLIYRTVEQQGTGISGDGIQTAMVSVLMSEGCYLERAELFEVVQGNESVNDKYLLYLIETVLDRIDRLGDQQY